ncbi:MAG TPA: hypothetical protein GXZ23_03030 [Clostridiales bacterium]|nr:hypothetical protein [Clostridiales bacterium]
MRKLKVFLRRIKSMSFKRMFELIGLISKEHKRPSIIIFFDMIWCSLRYGMGYLDYKVFGFASIHGKNRKTFMTMNHNLAYVRSLNDKEAYHYLDNKIEFNKKFSEYLGRDWIDLSETDINGLQEFCKGKHAVFAKQAQTFGGQGIDKIEITPDINYTELYQRLTENKQFLIEDCIIQHDEMNKLCPSSINTIRMVTVATNNIPHFMYALVRMGAGDKAVDNISSGGMYTSVNEKGMLTKPAFCDKTGIYYDRHPKTNTEFNGFVIPYFDEAVEMCKSAAMVLPNLRYIGWDVAITPNGPVLVEGNNFPSYDMVQNYRHLDGKTGILPKFEKVINNNV